MSSTVTVARALIPRFYRCNKQRGIVRSAQRPLSVSWRAGCSTGIKWRRERLASDRAIEIIQTWRPTAHERVQHHLSVVIKGRTEHSRHRQDNVPIDPPLVQDPAHLADPVVHGDFGAS